MDSPENSSVDLRLSALEKNVAFIAQQLQLRLNAVAEPARPAAPQPASPAAPLPRNPAPRSPTPVLPSATYRNTTPAASAGQLLGFAGIACLFLAVILLIRFSIDSGWLTPERQIILAGVFGGLLIALPFVMPLKDDSYMSQLPALGIVVLHLTIYGAVFYHKILAPEIAIVMISAVGILSLLLLKKFEYEAYVLISIVGTYVGALALQHGFPSHIVFFCFLMVWNLIYCAYSVLARERKIILITSYIAIGLLSLRVYAMPQIPAEFAKVATAQAIQFLVFLGAVTVFSTVNKWPLRKEEAWSFFPLLLFFYGLEYHLLDKIDPNYATAFAILFSALVYGSYKWARRTTSEMLDSADVTYTMVALVLSHAFYLVLFNDQFKILTPLFFMAILFAFRARLINQDRFRGGFFVLTLVTLYSFGLLSAGGRSLTPEFLIFVGAIYGVLILYASKPLATRLTQKGRDPAGTQSVALLLAHSQVLLAIYRLKYVLIEGPFIAALWIGYAFIILAVALKTTDKILAQSSFPVIVLGLARFVLVDFGSLESGARILALLVMGGLIFAGGYMYKKIVGSAGPA